MADDVTLNSGSGGDVIAADDIGGVKHQRVKVQYGADGAATDVSDSNPLPIDDAGGSLTIDSAQLPAALAANGGLKVEGVAGGVAVPVSAASLPLPSGAATAAKQDTGNTSLASIDGKITAVNTGAVVVSSSALPSGAATAANQSTGNTALAAIQTAVELIDDAVAAEDAALGKGVLLQGDDGTDRKNVAVDTDGNLQADIVGSLPAGTNAIGKLAPNTGVDIGDVDVTSVVPGSGATNLGKAEDGAHTTGDVGVMALAVRKAADAPLSGTDGDYEPLQTDENGFLKVNIKAGAGSGGTAATDDAAFTAGAGSGTPMMGLVTADAVDSGDVGVVGMDANRNLKVSIEVDNVGIGGGTQYTEDDAAPANPVGTAIVAQRDDALGGLTPVEGDWSHLYCDAVGALWVKQSGTVTVDGSGVTQPISAASLPLPTGAATSANQDTANTALAGIQTAAEIMDDWDESDRAKVNPIVGQAGVAGGSGAVGATTQRVTLATDVALPAGDNNIGNVDVVTLPALAAGTNNIGDVDVASIAAGTNLIGDVGIQPRTSGGLTMHKTISAASTNATSVKGSAGQVYALQVLNINAAPRYLKLYNKASAPTVGTDTPVKTLTIPGNTAGAGFIASWAQGLEFTTGIAFALTTGVADSDTGAVAANEIVVNLDYK